ncbi:MAG: hypothetical protein R3E97_09490 [Candidatus Eisenbacteria bacterium]
MHIKRFEAATVKEALARIRSELGPDALILETHRATDGSGWFEVTAALPHGDADSRSERARTAYGAASASQTTAPARRAEKAAPSAQPALPSRSNADPDVSRLASLLSGDSDAEMDRAFGLDTNRAASADVSRPGPNPASGGGISKSGVVSRVADILSRLPRESVAPNLTPEQRRKFLGDSAPEALAPRKASFDATAAMTREPGLDSFDRTETSRPTSSPHDRGRASNLRLETRDDEEVQRLRDRNEYLSRLIRSEHFSAIPLPLRELYLDLSEAEVDSNLVFQILSRMGQAPMKGKFQPVPAEEFLPRLEPMISVGGEIRREDGRRVVALVGPTGVGKTTTLAKIAGQAAFRHGKKVALVSTDAYRVFGAQHLGSYATLMGLPFSTADRGSAMRRLLEDDFAEADLVLIDTSGRSPRDPEGIEEIHQILAACPEAEIQLVLAANSRVRDMAFALEGFSRLPIRHLVFTKLDETTRQGGLFTLALKARKPVAYLATGQEVPDDLHVATVEALTQGITGREEPTVA